MTMARYQSTRGGESLPAGRAILAGLAPDGGLFVPLHFPRMDAADFGDLGAASPAEVAVRLLAPFLEGDALADSLEALCHSALNFPMPLVTHERDGNALRVLELFHGPTAAFKDVGARFLAECFTRAEDRPRPLTILVATSGDTGGAVAAAFHRNLPRHL